MTGWRRVAASRIT